MWKNNAVGKERIYSRIEFVGDCWIFIGTVGAWGYGRFNDGYAHCISYELFVGPIPEGFQVDHVRDRGCQSRLCVNPAHLEAVTQRENSRRALCRTECAAGHSLVEGDPNVYVAKNGDRKCRACHALRQRRYRKAKRLQAV